MLPHPRTPHPRLAAVRELGGFGDALVPEPPWDAELRAWDSLGSRGDGQPTPPDPSRPASAADPASCPTAALLGRIVAPVFFSPLLAAVLTGSPHATSVTSSRAANTTSGGLPADILESLTGSGYSLGGLPPGGLLRALADGGGDHARLLAHCLQALAVFLECARASADSPAMARALLPLAWMVRQHRELGLRRAALTAVAAVLAAMYRRRAETLGAPSVLQGVHAVSERPRPSASRQPLVAEVASGGVIAGSGRDASSAGDVAMAPIPGPLDDLLSVGAHARAAETAGYILSQAPPLSSQARSRTDTLLAAAAIGRVTTTVAPSPAGLTMWDDLLEVTGKSCGLELARFAAPLYPCTAPSPYSCRLFAHCC